MAIIPGTRYPAQTDADTDYPHGKARNSGSFQDGTGTPLEKDWLNDLWGFNQALLAAASITPSGDPDKVGASQYLAALMKIAALKFATYKIPDSSGSPLAFGAAFILAEDTPTANVVNGFTLDSNRFVRLPGPGRYLGIAMGNFGTHATGNPSPVTIAFSAKVDESSVFQGIAGTQRYSATVLQALHIAAMTVGYLSPENVDTDADTLAIRSLVSGATIFNNGSADRLFILKLG